jgi:hypothetical protein
LGALGGIGGGTGGRLLLRLEYREGVYNKRVIRVLRIMLVSEKNRSSARAYDALKSETFADAARDGTYQAPFEHAIQGQSYPPSSNLGAPCLQPARLCQASCYRGLSSCAQTFVFKRSSWTWRTWRTKTTAPLVRRPALLTRDPFAWFVNSVIHSPKFAKSSRFASWHRRGIL